MIGRNGERGSGISALAARLDDDDDILMLITLEHSIDIGNVSVFITAN